MLDSTYAQANVLTDKAEMEYIPNPESIALVPDTDNTGVGKMIYVIFILSQKFVHPRIFRADKFLFSRRKSQ